MERVCVPEGEEGGEVSVRWEREGEREDRGVTKADEGRLLSSSCELSELDKEEEDEEEKEEKKVEE